MKTRHPVNASVELRARSEAALQRRNASGTAQTGVSEPESVSRRLHELQVHQIELELQNEDLRQTQQQLEAVQLRYLDLYDQAPVGYCTVSSRGLIVEANRTLGTWMGCDRTALLARPFSSLIVEGDQHLLQGLRERVLALSSASEPARSVAPPCELRLLKCDGTTSWALLGATAAVTDAGEFALRVALTDIDARVAAQRSADEETGRLTLELERRVLERTHDLLLANRELEAFSYSVSHDLRAPLRGVGGYLRMLEEDCAAQLDANGIRLLGKIGSEHRRMEQLIDDLLRFSRLGRTPMVPESIDMTELTRAVFAELRNHATGARARFELAQLPPATGDLAMVRQVLGNLLDNALKFSSQEPAPLIQVGWTLTPPPAADTGSATAPGAPTAVTYYVRDNGAGFDEHYSGKLFTVFQRLHSDSEFPGTGVGLALVQRIVQRHGGRVWAQGKVGSGATFYFTLESSDRVEQQSGGNQPAEAMS